MNARTPPAYSLRPATPDDLTLTYTITRDAMRGYAEQAWGPWDEAEQQAKHQANFTPATHRIVLLHGRPAGLVATELEPKHLWLVKLYLLAAHRGQGLGTALLQKVLDEAADQGKPVRLRVLRVNAGARRLYLRHGFRVVGETPERFFMER